MADGQHSRRDGGVLAAGRETARRASLEVSRRTLLGAVCASPLARHPGLDPGPRNTVGSPARTEVSLGPGLRRDDGWGQALACFRTAQAAVDAASGEPDQERYDALLDSATDARCTLLALPAPNLPALAAKLDAIVPYFAWELTGSEDCLEILRHDAHRLSLS